MTPDLPRTIAHVLAIGERRRRIDDLRRRKVDELLAAIDRRDWAAVVACGRELRGTHETSDSVAEGEHRSASEG